MSELVTKNCPVCFVDYAIPRAMNDARRRDGGDWCCPNGHSLHFMTTEIDTVRAERDRLKQQMVRVEDEKRRAWNSAAEQREMREAAERRASAARGQVTKLKNRAANGVCPCCNRTFVNLQRHMASKHPKFTAEEVTPEGATIQ